MYAVVATSGKQFKVEEGQELLVDRINVPPGQQVEFDRVLMIGDRDGEEPRIGQPAVEGTLVRGRVVRHERGPKVVTVRYKGPSQTKIGHRQDYTRVKIDEIVTG